MSLRGVKCRAVALCKRDFSDGNINFKINTQDINRIIFRDDYLMTGRFFGHDYRRAGRVPNESLTHVENISQAAFLNFIYSCPKLNSLDAASTENFDDSVVNLIPQHILDNITSVHFWVSATFTSVGLIQFANSLENLTLAAGPEFTCNKFIELLKATKGSLKSMNLIMIVTDALIEAISLYCPLLVNLTFGHTFCEYISNITYIAKILQCCKNLKYADFQGDYYDSIVYNKFANEGFYPSHPHKTTQNNNNMEIKKLKIHGKFADVSPTHLAEFFDIITHVDFKEISIFRHVINDHLLSTIRIRNPSLLVLEYEFCIPTYHVGSMLRLGEGCPNLHTLSMVPVKQLSNDDIALLFANKDDCVFKNLRHLRLSENETLTEQTVFNILTNNNSNSSSSTKSRGGLCKLEVLECYAMKLFSQDCVEMQDMLLAA